jgi:hypothetical protein
MEIAGDYEDKKPKSLKGRKEKEPVVAVKREARAAPAASECHIKLLSLCF